MSLAREALPHPSHGQDEVRPGIHITDHADRVHRALALHPQLLLCPLPLSCVDPGGVGG